MAQVLILKENNQILKQNLFLELYLCGTIIVKRVSINLNKNVQNEENYFHLHDGHDVIRV